MAFGVMSQESRVQTCMQHIPTDTLQHSPSPRQQCKSNHQQGFVWTMELCSGAGDIAHGVLRTQEFCKKQRRRRNDPKATHTQKELLAKGRNPECQQHGGANLLNSHLRELDRGTQRDPKAPISPCPKARDPAPSETNRHAPEFAAG